MTNKKITKPTLIWNPEKNAPINSEDYIIVPRTILKLGRYFKKTDFYQEKWENKEQYPQLHPRHLIFLLLLASRKFEETQIRAYWEELAQDLGFKKETIRKWGRELKEMGLIHTKQMRGRDPKINKPGIRNDRNIFDISPFVELIQEAYEKRKDIKRAKRGKDDSKNDS